MRQLVRSILNCYGLELRQRSYGDKCSWLSGTAPLFAPKARNVHDRFREIISDPLNILIDRVPLAGIVCDGLVKLHTGTLVPIEGAGAYHSWFSEILALNRGVHEPLEEFVFQELMRAMPPAPTMLELGAYWGHYSMWMKTVRPEASVFLVEPEAPNLKVGIENFERNKMNGTFIQAMVGNGHFEVDRFLDEQNIAKLDVLHSDIQGAEVEMLEGCRIAFAHGRISYCLVSTHSQELHRKVEAALQDSGFRIEASADFEHETTSYDGLVFAAHQDSPVILKDFRYLGRESLVKSEPSEILAAVNGYEKSRSTKSLTTSR